MGKAARLELADYCRFYDVRGIKKPCELRIFQDSLCVPPEYQKLPVLQLKDTTVDENTTVRRDTKELSNFSVSLKAGQGSSPFPAIDDFMKMVLQKRTPAVYFREWKTQEKDGKIVSITYYPSNSRFCFNIGREHKSNKTWWTVDLAKGHFYQKCFDSDCRGYISNYFPLPDFVKNIKTEEDKDESILDASQIEVENFFTNWDCVFDS